MSEERKIYRTTKRRVTLRVSPALAHGIQRLSDRLGHPDNTEMVRALSEWVGEGESPRIGTERLHAPMPFTGAEEPRAYEQLSQYLTVRMDDDLFEKLQHSARYHGRSFNSEIATALERWVAMNEEEHAH